MQRDDMTIKNILDLAFAFEKSRVLLSACELDIFSVISSRLKSAGEIASELDTDTKATERLLDSLVAIGLLEKKNTKYANTNISLRFLDKSKPEYIGLFTHQNRLWNLWGNLTETVKTGKPPEFTDVKDMPPNEVDSFIESVTWRASVLAHNVVKMLDISKVHKFLDLGGASGYYCKELLGLRSDIEVYEYIYPNFEEQTLKQLRWEGYADKINILTGDFMEDDIGSGYDLILISFLMHHSSIWDNIKLCKKVYDALKPGGRVVIQDYIVNDEKTSPEFNALLALETLVSTHGGNSYTETDFWIVLKESWFDEITRKDTEFGTSLIFGVKKAGLW